MANRSWCATGSGPQCDLPVSPSTADLQQLIWRAACSTRAGPTRCGTSCGGHPPIPAPAVPAHGAVAGDGARRQGGHPVPDLVPLPVEPGEHGQLVGAGLGDLETRWRLPLPMP